MRYLGLLFLIITPIFLKAQHLPGFKYQDSCDEQQMYIENMVPDTRILINAPINGFQPGRRVLLIFYALPNGNTIEQSFGKRIREGDDWHYDIQHIGAQTRFLRKILRHETIVVAYLEAKGKSWPAWKSQTAGYQLQTLKIVENIMAMFKPWNPRVVLNGHSGGGRFIFSYLDAVPAIPDFVERIAFTDSDYGYEDDPYGVKLVKWLHSGGKKYLSALAYNDSVVIYDGKPLVSPAGGTWYRTRLMLKYLSESFRFKKLDSDSLIRYSAMNRRIEVILKTNPDGKIFHTVQVELNGFIQSMLSGTRYEQKKYSYFGKRAYENYISGSIAIPIRAMNIPLRRDDAEKGSEFMNRISSLPREEREEEIYNAIASGNIPGFLRNTITVRCECADSSGILHHVEYEVLPDYLSVGDDRDFCRIPMNPYTAQRLASLFGASLITAKVSDQIYREASLKLTPFNYVPVGNANELVSKFIEHNARIEKQMSEAGGVHGQLVAGIKKDIILSTRMADHPGKVVIYGWHKPGGIPIQPVYSGHVGWYVDYSHGIRLINDQVLLDGKPSLFTNILKDPVLYKIFSNENTPIKQTDYSKQ